MPSMSRRPTAAARSHRRLRRRPPARSYLVFFDWDKATLTDRARQIIKEAADNSTHVQYTRIEVNGYTDTSGTHSVQSGPVASPRAARCRRNWSRTACRRMPSPSRASATRICWCRPGRACANRRTAGSRSSSADRTSRLGGARLTHPYARPGGSDAASGRLRATAAARRGRTARGLRFQRCRRCHSRTCRMRSSAPPGRSVRQRGRVYRDRSRPRHIAAGDRPPRCADPPLVAARSGADPATGATFRFTSPGRPDPGRSPRVGPPPASSPLHSGRTTPR